MPSALHSKLFSEVHVRIKPTTPIFSLLQVHVQPLLTLSQLIRILITWFSKVLTPLNHWKWNMYINVSVSDSNDSTENLLCYKSKTKMIDNCQTKCCLENMWKYFKFSVSNRLSEYPTWLYFLGIPLHYLLLNTFTSITLWLSLTGVASTAYMYIYATYYKDTAVDQIALKYMTTDSQSAFQVESAKITWLLFLLFLWPKNVSGIFHQLMHVCSIFHYSNKFWLLLCEYV